MTRSYIFIVGLPRTGTKMIADILHNAQHVHCKISPENFYMGHLIRPGLRQELKKFGGLTDEARVGELVEAMFAGQFPGTYWQLLKSGHLGVDRAMLCREILNSDRSEKGVYEALMRVHPEVTEATILGDKNPGHLYHVPELLAWFPEAKIIHTFRDPRAILASEWKKRISSTSTKFPGFLLRPFNSLLIVLHVTITWLYAVKLHYQYQRLYPQNYYLSRFEDVVANPTKSIKELCKFLEIDFHPEMLNPRQFDSSYAQEGETGFDPGALTRWQSYLKPWMKLWLLLWSRKYLREFGYIP